MKSKGKQLALNMVSQFMAFAVAMAINFFLVPVIIEKIGKDIYGFYSLSDNFLEYATIITTVINGMANRYITVAYSRGEIENANRYFTSVTVVNIVLTVILAIPAFFLVLFLEKMINIPANHVLDVKCLWAFVFLMFFVNLIFSRYETAPFVKNRLEITGLINVSSIILKALLLIVVYTFFYPYIGYIGAIVFLCAVYSSVLKVRFKKKLTPDLRFQKELFDIHAVIELAKVGVWNSVSQLNQILFTGLDLLIANLFLGAEDMSILSIAKTLPVMLISLIGVIAGAFYPTLTISYSTRSKEEFFAETNFASKMCGFLCSVPVIGIAVFGGDFFSLWLPTLTAEEIRLVQSLAILTLLPQAFSIYIFPLNQINTILCRVRLPAVIDGIIGVVNIIVVYLLLKFTNLGLYAIAGVSSCLLLLRIILFVPVYAAHNIGVKKTAFYPILLRGILLDAAAVLLCAAVRSMFVIDSWLGLFAAAIPAAAVSYAAGFFLIFSKSERKKAFTVVREKLQKEERT